MRAKRGADEIANGIASERFGRTRMRVMGKRACDRVRKTAETIKRERLVLRAAPFARALAALMKENAVNSHGPRIPSMPRRVNARARAGEKVIRV